MTIIPLHGSVQPGSCHSILYLESAFHAAVIQLHCCASKAFPVTTESPSLGWITILNSCICVRMSVLLQVFEVMDEVALNSHIQVFVVTKLIYL